MDNDFLTVILVCCCAGIIIFGVFSMLAPDNDDSDVNTTSSDNPSVASSDNPSTSSFSSNEGDMVNVTIEDIYINENGGSFAGSDYATLVPEGKTYMIGLNKNDYDTIIKYRGSNPIGKTITVRLGTLRSSTGNMKIYDYCELYNDNGEPIAA